MSAGKRCENCLHASNAIKESTEHATWITVDCNAPVPAYAETFNDDNSIGHVAAERCPCYATK